MLSCNHLHNAMPVMVIVYVVPPVIYVHPSNRTVEISHTSTDIVLTCDAYKASHYQWLKDNNTIQLNTTGNVTNTLLLANILPSDSGRYQCVAINKYGEAYSDFAELIVEGMYIQHIQLVIL